MQRKERERKNERRVVSRAFKGKVNLEITNGINRGSIVVCTSSRNDRMKIERNIYL